jgi:hypothetical protein
MRTVPNLFSLCTYNNCDFSLCCLYELRYSDPYQQVITMQNTLKQKLYMISRYVFVHLWIRSSFNYAISRSDYTALKNIMNAN